MTMDVERALERLGRTPAPASLLPGILGEVRPDSYALTDTVFGSAYVAFRDGRITAIMLADAHGDFEAHHLATVGRRARRVDTLPAALAGKLFRALTRGGRGPDVDVSWMTEFEQDVLRKTREIPLGEVRTYGWVAREIGRPRAVRAVGTALGHNPIPLLIPCHRVVRGDASIGQYSGGGPGVKRKILGIEGVDADELEALARCGVRFIGSDTTHVFCVPTCHHARRITVAHRVEFGSAASAADAGFRPCVACRPAGVREAA